ncbi:MAG: alpha/beta fold hydrolase [Acidimicrobiales bacterium]
MPGQTRDLSRALATETFGSGERIVLIHGFTQTGRSWAEQVHALSEHFEVVTVDLPGHGRSADVEVADLDDAGRLLVEAVGEATYVGYSMGGRVALHAAFHFPESVRTMVLAGVSPGIADEKERIERRRADEALAGRLDGSAGTPISLAQFLDEWLAQPLFASLAPEARGRAAREENTTTGLARALRRLGTGTQVYDVERLRRLEMPVFIVAGEHDAKFRALGEEMAAVIGKNAATSTVPSAGHAWPFERPTKLATAVMGFVLLQHHA